MANILYPLAKTSFLKGEIDLLNDDLKVSCLDSADYTYSAAHEFYDDANTNVVATSGNLTGKTVVNGVFNADDITLTAVTGDEFEYILLWQDTGDPATSRLIALYDTASGGLPMTPSGGDLIISWSVSGIFAL